MQMSVLRLSDIYYNVVVIEKATVPIIKLVESRTNLQIDISFNVSVFRLLAI